MLENIKWTIGVLAISFFSLISLSGCVRNNADLLLIGESNFQNQNYNAAFPPLLHLAKSGNCDAQYAVGYMYYYGKGIVENHQCAQMWINKAAQCGQPLAIKALEVEANAPGNWPDGVGL